MADDEKSQDEEIEQSSGGLGRIILVVCVVLASAIAGLSTYVFLLAPMLEATDDVAVQDEDPIPVMPVMIEFPQTPVNVIRDGEAPAATLLFGVTLECEDQFTADLVQLYLPRFVDVINKLHDSRTRSELDDTLLIKESIQRQALQKLNDILKRLPTESDSNGRITKVMHHTFVVQDPL